MADVAVASAQGFVPSCYAPTHNNTTAPQRTVSMAMEFVRTLNTGSTATVYEARDRSSGLRVAVKMIKRTEATERIVRREVRMQRGLRHENIARAYKFIETATHFLLIQELMEGGDLFDAITSNRDVSESTVMEWMKGVLAALVHLHDEKNIAHRDVKLENVMLAHKNGAQVKLIDFGFACEATEVSKTVPGTEEYVCPELLSGRLDSCLKKSDVWAAGILLWTLLSTKSRYDFPWQRADNSSPTFRQYLRGDLSFEPWANFSPAAKFLLLNMLAVDPTRRCTAAEALQFVNDYWPNVAPVVPTSPVFEVGSPMKRQRCDSGCECETSASSSSEDERVAPRLRQNYC